MGFPRSRRDASPSGKVVTRPAAIGQVAGANETAPPAPRPDSFEDVARWRDSQRCRLRAVRSALDAETRSAIAEAVHRRLDAFVAALFGTLAGRCLVCYRPIRDEIDLTAWMVALHGAGAVVGVPQARNRHEALRFRRWMPAFEGNGCLQYAPVAPPESAEIERPDLVVAPVLGWDAAGYRLGYGTGSFDRTLSRLGPETVTVGVGLEDAKLATIHPQPFDIRLGHVITEAATRDF